MLAPDKNRRRPASASKSHLFIGILPPIGEADGTICLPAAWLPCGNCADAALRRVLASILPMHPYCRIYGAIASDSGNGTFEGREGPAGWRVSRIRDS